MTSESRFASPPIGLADALEGCLLGTAAGDMLGLPFENLSRAHVARLLREPLEQSLFLGRGLISDDTEHTAMVARSLLEERHDASRFARRFAARLRWWLLSAPPGVGGATARGVIKLWLGFPPSRSGVRSAGNGPAMRAAAIGVLCGDDHQRLASLTRASTAVTHTDDRAYDGALLVACAAACGRAVQGRTPLEALAELRARHARARSGEAGPLTDVVDAMRDALLRGLDVGDYARSLGCGDGVTGFVMHTVPVAIYAWLVHSGDFRRAITEVVRCGGDTDSVAAITGAIVGASLGPAAIPATWLARTLEYPGTVARLRRLARQLADAEQSGRASATTVGDSLAEAAWWPWMLGRNLAMFVLLVGVLVRRTALIAMRR